MSVDYTDDIKPGEFYTPITEPTLPPLPKPQTPPREPKQAFWGGFLLAVLIMAFIVIMGFLVYYVSEGMFKTEVNQEVTFEPEINVTTQNEYSFNPSTSNDFNNQFYNNITLVVENLHIVTNSS